MIHTLPEHIQNKINPLHRGLWANLEDGMELPVGGSVFSSQLTTKLHLDFNTFPKFIDIQTLDTLYEQRKAVFTTWFGDLPESFRKSVDQRIYFVLMAVQNGMEHRLGILPDVKSTSTYARNEKYNHITPKLSDFRDGTALCAERAALGYWMLQSVGIPSVYMSGVTFCENLNDGADHSWIVLYPDTDSSMIFDIARPEQNNLPNLYKSEVPFSKYLFEGKDNAFIETKKLLKNTTRFFGVSDHPSMTDESAHIVREQVVTLLAPL